MLDWLTQNLGAFAEWIEAHPAAVAWMLGWIGALSAAQLVKMLVIPSVWGATRARNVTQLTAAAVGSAIAWTVWPTASHAVAYACVVGLSAPTAYNLIVALIQTRWPEFAANLSRDIGD